MTTFSLRPAQEGDKWAVLEWRNHADVRAVMLTDHIIAKTEHAAWWDKTMLMDQRQILIFCRNEKPVGVVTIYSWEQDKATAWWGFYLNNSALEQAEKTAIWLELEQAVIHYAGKTLKVHELYCESLRQNQLAWKLHQKSGFVECEAPVDATDTAKNVVYMKYVYPENKLDKRQRLYLFASHNTDFLSDTLTKHIKTYTQFPYKIATAEFGRYQLDLLDSKNSDMNDASSCYAFIERIEDFFPDIYTLPTEESLLETEQRMLQYLAFIKNIAQRGNRVFVADFAIQKGFPFSTSEQLSDSKIQRLIQEWNNKLYMMKTNNLVEVIPYSQIIKRAGQSFSNKYWYMARAPFSIQFLEAYSQALIGTIFAANALSARVLVLDLDNTLWKGIIGDDGKEGISLGGDYPGNIYKDLQSLFLTLKSRGILLTICSKNTEEVALDAIETHPEMRLRAKDFVSYRINWEPKSQNIQALSKELNLGLSSFCFIDDNPVERAEVRRNAPDVFVPELPEDPAEWFQYLCNLPELCVAQVSESDKRRSELYKQRVDIQNAQTEFVDRESFIKSLGMEVCVEELNSDNFDRTHQLFNKTNQFNTTTTRYSKEQLNEWMRASDHQVLHVRSKDKYSKEYEGVAALVIVKQDNRWVIDNFVMSCRVMGRDIEHVIISKLILLASESSQESVVGRFIASSKNMPVRELYKSNHFVLDDNEQWVFEFAQQSLPSESNLMTLNWKA
ncbi:UDP-4-amino-4,6-dideoxy-N-acetyl-beta-L-altrosamine N-acetyltransferase [Vibrio parahaemolyticus]|nr:UDP-4-amino-4,6-dideoxy-N-acetyl-beta-L-altrosamine N-acetyltransferase [Vibrio parahaemolyticus]EIU6801135.1 UDP-4-amino-4,6-dideoxy-N-acetyl-beta-L-altrosamine N-acetyltransferase [Vibrio parahaemolyticus]